MQSLHLFVGLYYLTSWKKTRTKISHPFNAALLALNIPLLLLFDNSESLFGFPIIYIYILSAWLFSIAISHNR
jgi:hypothetical protein